MEELYEVYKHILEKYFCIDSGRALKELWVFSLTHTQTHTHTEQMKKFQVFIIVLFSGKEKKFTISPGLEYCFLSQKTCSCDS